MVVHSDQAGDDGVAVEVEDLGIFRKVGRGGIAYGINLSFVKENRLIFAGGGAGAIDDADVSEGDEGGVNGDKRFDVR